MSKPLLYTIGILIAGGILIFKSSDETETTADETGADPAPAKKAAKKTAKKSGRNTKGQFV